jgi:hypothetical protein
MLAAVLAFAAPAFLLTACNDDPLFEIPPDAPTDVTVAVQGTSATVAWTVGAGATSQEVRVSPVDVQENDIVQTINDNTTNSALFEDLIEGWDYTATVTAINAGASTSSDAVPFTIPAAVLAPELTTFRALELDPTSLLVVWTPAPVAENYAVGLVPDDGGTVIVDTFPAAATEAIFSPDIYPELADRDGVTYTAQVYAVIGGEGFGSNTMTWLLDYFPWDDYFPISLHETGAGKTTYYDEVPNRGFEEYTNVPYDQLACIGCHSSESGLGPVNGRTCSRCHTDVTDPELPPLGSEVNTSWEDGVCNGCHSRQGLEKSLYTDVHRDMGFDCMACHTLEDVMGDGTEYLSLQDIGAIDSECTDCHDASTHPAGNPHGEDVACATCHAQSTVTCNNCHFEAQVENTGKFFLTPPAHNWMWLGNRLKRDGSGETEVYPVNYQSVAYLDTTFVAFGFYTPHTIGPAATARGCSDCHFNMGGAGSIPAIDQYNAEGIIDVATWDPGIDNMVYPTGVVPLPEDFLESLKFDFATSADNGATWTFLKTGADTIQILPQYVTPLSVDQMGKLGMVKPAP